MKRPNVLFIMSDDHAANSISCYNSILSEDFKTPGLDRVGNEGLRLEKCYSTNSICTPSRATVMTGQYSHTNGVRTLNDSWEPATATVNMAKSFHDNGYYTSMIGKWHLHCTPTDFDDYKVLTEMGGQGTYYNPLFLENEKGEVRYEGYTTDIITDFTIENLKNKPADKPFFMMCHHKAPHDLFEYNEKYEHIFDGIDLKVPDSLFEDRSHRSEASRDFGSSITTRNPNKGLHLAFAKPTHPTGQLILDDSLSFEEKGIAVYQKYMKDYLRTTASIDESVARLLDTLEEMGELDNTIFIYTSDQGMFLGEHDYQDKRWSYEESLRIPFMIRCPRFFPVGKVNNNLVANIDIVPTLLDLCDIEIPEAVQGVSQKDVLVDAEQEHTDVRDEVYFRYWMHLTHHDNPAHFGIRTQDYKLIYYYGRALDANNATDIDTPQGFELYNMKADPLELHNIYNDEKYKDVVEDMMNRLRKVRAEIGDTDEKFADVVNFH